MHFKADLKVDHHISDLHKAENNELSDSISSPILTKKISFQVYVLAYPRNGLVHLVHRNSMLSLLLLALVFIFIVISLCTYLFLTARATNREMFLCASLIKQTEATQQAERKSMNKTKAFAGANHDVRNSLAAVRASIHFCQEEANPESKLAAQLVQLENHTKDLLG